MKNETDIARQTDLVAALGATRGVVVLVGAGGKKTTLYALAKLHPGRVAMTSTSHMYTYDEARVDRVVRVHDEGLADGDAARVVAYAGATDTRDRVGGLSEDQIRALWARGIFDLMLIKGDGARARWIKAPAAHEPLIPAFTDTVIAVVSARVLGRRLGDGIAHRPELAAAVMQTDLDTPLRPEHLARLLVSPRGLLKGVGAARVVPLLNMVDDDAVHAGAAEAARLALASTARFDRVVLAAMKAPRLVEVIGRGAG